MDNPAFSNGQTLGVLGGGQLGKMMLTKCRQWDLHTIVLDPSETAPARLLANNFYVGDLMDYQTVVDFGQNADIITIEIENVNVEALQTLQEQGKKVFPKPETLAIIQDKAKQKQFYKTHKLPTADFQSFDIKPDWDSVKAPLIWKASRFGYDGFGVKKIENQQHWEALPDVPCITESCVAIDKEIAIIVARNPKGDCVSYPPVEMEFNSNANQVEFVCYPSTLTPQQANACKTLAEQLTNAIDHVGLLAVELFLDSDGNILINEVAPRPHNSGHLSIEAAVTSQFEQHLRTILGLPFGNCDFLQHAIMINVVGDPGHHGPVQYKGIDEILSISQTQLHLYGKAETRPMRKMGHITLTGTNIDELRQKAAQVKTKLKVHTI
jgi:5-(carboxyamino)imidazole ribonucleotide synthase